MSNLPEAATSEIRQHGITLLFGGKILLLNFVLTIIGFVFFLDALEAFTLGYVQFGLMLLGLVAQLYSIPLLRDYAWPFKTRLLWWLCMIVHALWYAAVSLGLLVS